jgi:hypothetical protein
MLTVFYTDKPIEENIQQQSCEVDPNGVALWGEKIDPKKHDVKTAHIFLTNENHPKKAISRMTRHYFTPGFNVKTVKIPESLHRHRRPLRQRDRKLQDHRNKGQEYPAP